MGLVYFLPVGNGTMMHSFQATRTKKCTKSLVLPCRHVRSMTNKAPPAQHPGGLGKNSIEKQQRTRKRPKVRNKEARHSVWP